jgi:hypothetical protein
VAKPKFEEAGGMEPGNVSLKQVADREATVVGSVSERDGQNLIRLLDAVMLKEATVTGSGVYMRVLDKNRRRAARKSRLHAEK